MSGHIEGGSSEEDIINLSPLKKSFSEKSHLGGGAYEGTKG